VEARGTVSTKKSSTAQPHQGNSWGLAGCICLHIKEQKSSQTLNTPGVTAVLGYPAIQSNVFQKVLNGSGLAKYIAVTDGGVFEGFKMMC
jgi:hypothetical protein